MEVTQYQCIGCGAMIQTFDPDQMGYLPKSALDKGLEKGAFYCQRCFRLRHYNELQDLQISDDVFLDKLNQIAEDDAFVVKVIDIFDVEGSIIHGLNRIIGKQPFVVLANKVDLLPKVTNHRRLKHWVKVMMNAHDLYPDQVLLASANKASTLDELTSLIEAVIQKKNVYIVGVTNVGKSTLINQLITRYGGEKSIVTTSNHPGTTLDLIEIPLNQDHAIIDTPGIIHRSQLAHYLDRQEMKQVLPTKPFKPKTFQLNPQQTIFLAGLARVDFLKGPRTSFTFYLSNDLYLHRTKLAEADQIYAKHRGHLLSPPNAQTLDQFPPLVAKTIHLSKDQDVAISGLGWLTVNQDVTIQVWVPKNVNLSVRQAII
ncbi:TPA: ribosome biogenesis GTPase YqeH [Streptococcus suis]